MASPKTAALSGLLVSKRSAEAPRPEHPGLEQAQTPAAAAATPLAALQAAEEPGGGLEEQPAEQPAGTVQSTYYKALTLKVDRERFTKLKTLGVQRDLRSQALLTEALDLLFARHGM